MAKARRELGGATSLAERRRISELPQYSTLDLSLSISLETADLSVTLKSKDAGATKSPQPRERILQTIDRAERVSSSTMNQRR